MSQAEPWPTPPTVRPTSDRTVAVELSPDQAEVLARILAHYEALTTSPRLREVDPTLVGRLDVYQPGVWQHTIVQLLTARAVARAAAPVLSMVSGRIPDREPVR